MACVCNTRTVLLCLLDCMFAVTTSLLVCFSFQTDFTRRGSRTHPPPKPPQSQTQPFRLLKGIATQGNIVTFCGWIRVRRSNADSLGAALWMVKELQKCLTSCSGGGDPSGKAGLSNGPAGRRAWTLAAGSSAPTSSHAFPPRAPSPLHYFRRGMEGRKRAYFLGGFFPVVRRLPGIGSFLCLCASSLLCI